jgi:hypothetical protein
VKKEEKDSKIPMAQEPVVPYDVKMKSFSSQEEAEHYNMVQNIEMSDMQKFESFCRMLRMQQIFNRAKIYDMKDLK